MPVGRTNSVDGPVAGHVAGDRLRLTDGAPGVLEALATDASAAHRTIGFHPELPVDWTASLRDCVGFLDHVRNCRRARGVFDELPPPWFDRPAFYFANPASLHPWDAPVALPPGSAAFDFEFEIAAVLTSGGANLTVAEATACIGGYVLYCDWSARDIQAEERVMQIGQGKGKDAAVSLGPWILSAPEAEPYRRADGFSFEVSVQVNGETVLAKPFTGMDWSFEELVAYASSGAEVRPGDLIASGTIPGGCLLEGSAAPGFSGWLQAGDHVLLDGGPLGTISSRLAAPAPAVPWRRPPAPGTARTPERHRP
ncbi:fumarylacetoacetate hydrolase family protein [Streptomyces zingiberis]|uniref:Fumarylacetoacetate hydrolase family protein n=1 Tax=Streptomyces zingiberis TaxID=2053010 RepID=A0ABX1BWC8_9ACTN|nr:fumarylacetoacetate hydrolase family protein [Streptomyces zingiberis]NJQ00190.1 fumarylacetoacetate hydrolase family protein [Streptomyces zingiberis]